MKAKGFGKRPPPGLKWDVPITLERTQRGGKWFVVMHLNGRKRYISPHWKKRDAKKAAVKVRKAFGRHTEEQLKDGELYFNVLISLDYPDDDVVPDYMLVPLRPSLISNKDLEND